jgi:hypothetical protein
MSRLHTVFLAIILVLVSLNLLLTINLYQFHGEYAQKNEQDSSVNVQAANDLAKEVVALYNAKDFDSLYEKFDTQAKIKLNKTEFKVKSLALYALFGEIQAYDYLNSMKIGEKQHEKYYQLFYAVKVSTENIPKANLVLSVIVEDEKITLYGVKLSTQ